ncbi:MAG: c-type cytochrome [Fuerstiella sp.]|nr:c-type cytochrome [Fuerstiella sp.]MCP4853544.1 c-type cytochrome [Fuerstiella sp.]
MGNIVLGQSDADRHFPDRESLARHERVNRHVPPASFELDEGLGKDLKIEVWATSPLLFSPVAMDMDARGRMWLTEGIDYSTTHAGQRRVAAGKSIIVVSDTDGDGKADESHVFVTEKHIRHAPLGIAVFDNKIVLSASPEIIIYTDVNRNAVFEPGIDKREVLLTGFRGAWHDHTLHAVVGSPSGQWYFSFGNCGADVRTRDDRRFVTSSYYHNSQQAGVKSSDGHLYIGGMAMRINPDGTGLTAIGHNLRNTHDMAVNSFGDVYQNDNDDPPHCRATWLMEYGNLGYAGLFDGSRSWQETAKSWETPGSRLWDWSGHSQLGRRHTPSHWRENYPGTLPPGTIYGSGAPVGAAFYEGDALGPELRGTFLSCEMVRRELQIYQPKLTDAQIEMGPTKSFVGLRPQAEREMFLPTDIVTGTDGALYLADFYNNTSAHNYFLSGTIYRISRKDESSPKRPDINYKTTAGLVEALKSPASSVRAVAVPLLVSRSDAIVSDMQQLFQTESNPYVQARAIWVLAQAGPEGRSVVEELFSSDNIQWRITAYRALRFAKPDRLLEYAARMASDEAASVRREVALSLRDIPFEQCKHVLAALIAGFDGRNRWYLEAIGTAAMGKEATVYSELIHPLSTMRPYIRWSERDKNLAWRFHTPQAIDDLVEVIAAQKPKIDEFRHLTMAFASYSSESELATYRAKLESLRANESFKTDEYRQAIDQIVIKDLTKPRGALLNARYTIPEFLGRTKESSDVKTIAALEGSVDRGKARISICRACHQINEMGVEFGPNLSQWGRYRTIEQIVEEIVQPSARLAHGYEMSVRVTRGRNVAEGIGTNFAVHGPGSEYGGSFNVRVFGGETHKILFRREGAKVEVLKNHSWMPTPSKLDLKDQDVRDIAEYLKSL